MPKLTGLLREIFPSARDYRDWLLRPILIYSSHLKGHIMSALDDLNAKVDALQASADAANSKADALIASNAAASAQVGDLQAQIATLTAAGGASADDLAAVGAKIDAIKAGLDEQAGQDDAALAPAAEALNNLAASNEALAQSVQTLIAAMAEADGMDPADGPGYMDTPG